MFAKRTLFIRAERASRRSLLCPDAFFGLFRPEEGALEAGGEDLGEGR